MRLSGAAKIKKGFLSSIALVGSWGIVAQLVNFLGIPILTRLYGPEAFAQWALVTGFFLILGTVATLRYELAIVLPGSDRDAANLFVLSLGLALVATMISLLIVAFFQSDIVNFLGFQVSKNWIFLTPLLIGITGVNATIASWLTRKKAFFLLAGSGIVLISTTVTIQILAAWVGGMDSASGLIRGTVYGHITATTILSVIVMYWHGREIWSSLSFKRMRELGVQYRSYPFYMTPYTLVGVFRERGLIYLINIFSTPVLVGYFALAQKLTSFPVTMISKSIRPILFQRASRDTSETLGKLVTNLLEIMVCLGTPVLVFVLFHPGDIVSFCFGAAWYEAGEYAAYLSIPAFGLLLTNWLDRLFDVRGRQRLAFSLEMFFSTVCIAIFSAGFLLGGELRHVLMLQAGTMLIYKFIWINVVFRVAGFELQGLFRVYKKLAFYGLGSAIVFYSGEIFLSPVADVFVIGIIAICGYLVFSLRNIIRSPLVEELV